MPLSNGSAAPLFVADSVSTGSALPSRFLSVGTLGAGMLVWPAKTSAALSIAAAFVPYLAPRISAIVETMTLSSASEKHRSRPTGLSTRLAVE